MGEELSSAMMKLVEGQMLLEEVDLSRSAKLPD